jgi:guanine deaminase
MVQERFMRRAIALALENVSAGRGGPFAAVVVRGDAVLAEGTNQVTATNDPSAHAEMLAVRAACRQLGHFQLTGCEIYSSCEPCPMCLGLIYWARPDRVYYAATAEDAAAIGFDDSRIYRELQSPPAARSIPMTQMLRNDALAAFRAWQVKPDKIPY